MIVESVPVFQSRPKSSDTSGSDRRSTASGDDAFGRTLSDVLTADRSNRSDRPARPDRPGHQRTEKGGPRGAEHRRDRNDGDEDDERRPGSEERPAPAAGQDRAGRVTGRDQHGANGDEPSTDADQPSTTGLEQAIQRISEQRAEAPHGQDPAGLTTALAQLTEKTDVDADPDVGLDANADLGLDADPDVGLDANADPGLEANADLGLEADVDTAITTVDQVSGGETLVDDRSLANGDGEDPELDTTIDGHPVVDPGEPVGDRHEPVVDPGDRSQDPIDNPRRDGQRIAEVARDHRGSSLVEVVAEMVDSGQLEAGSRVAPSASAVAAVATSGTRPSTDGSMDEVTSTDGSSTTGDGAEIEVDAGEIESPSLPPHEPPSSDGESGQQEPAEPSIGAAGQPSSKPLGIGSERATATAPSPATTAPAGPTRAPIPELVELNTSGLAERLRPAFAAVRRGLNGLDELRLRIQDDNAGPIKVDIATVDNRVRVLLSAGNDDLMRQLGQERDRLADELRRAGFDQASIDIAADHGGERRAGYDNDNAAPSGTGSDSAGRSGTAGTDELASVATSRGRQTSGLDLDL